MIKIATALLALSTAAIVQSQAGQGSRPVIHTQEIEVLENGFASANLPQSPTPPIPVSYTHLTLPTTSRV